MKKLILALAAACTPVAAAAATPAVCSFPEYAHLLDAVAVPTSDDPDTYEPSQLADLEPELQRQVIKATRTRSLAGARDAVARSEDEVVYVQYYVSAVLPADYYTVVTYYPGGNQYGAIFEADRATPVAVIEDGEINRCKVLEPSMARTLRNVPYVDGSNPAHAAYKGFEELRQDERYGVIGDRSLMWHRAAGQDTDALNKTRLKQIAAARRAIVHFSSAYGEALAAGRYFEDAETRWEIYRMTDLDTGKTYDVVHFNESDDGSHTVVLAPGTSRVVYVYYEN